MMTAVATGGPVALAVAVADAVGLPDPAELGAGGELDPPEPAIPEAGVDTGRVGSCFAAAAGLTPKMARGQWVCHPVTASVPAKRTMASGTATGNHPDRPRLAPAAVSCTGGSAPMLTGPGSVSRLRSTDSCPEETSSREPQLRQKRAKSLFCSPHAAHRWSPAKAETPPKPSKTKSTPYRSQRAMADLCLYPAGAIGWITRSARGAGGGGPGGRGPGPSGPGGRRWTERA